jgi:hypothetical protein
VDLESAFELQRSLVQELAPTERRRPRAYAMRPEVLLADRMPVSARMRTAPTSPPRARGIALGVAVADGDFKLGIRVQDEALTRRPEVKRAVEAAEGEADVRVIGRLTPRAGPDLRTRIRPVQIGSSIAHVDHHFGTLGAFVRLRDGRVGFLSNNHVLARSNGAKPGDAIVQPGPWDGGGANDVVGRLASFVPLKPQRVNRVDVAVAALAGELPYDPRALPDGQHLDPVVLEPRQDVVVEKLGRTTGRTRGRITALNVSVLDVDYGSMSLRFDGQLEITDLDAPFSADGDSGALVYDEQGHRPVGLVFSGDDAGDGPGVTYVNPLTSVLEATEARLVP